MWYNINMHWYKNRKTGKVTKSKKAKVGSQWSLIHYEREKTN